MTFVEAPRPHHCQPPMAERWITPPRFDADGPPPKACLIYEIPTAGSVWRCDCGRHWMTFAKRQYVNLISFGNEWMPISGRRYRRQVKRLGRVAT